MRLEYSFNDMPNEWFEIAGEADGPLRRLFDTHKTLSTVTLTYQDGSHVRFRRYIGVPFSGTPLEEKAIVRAVAESIDRRG